MCGFFFFFFNYNFSRFWTRRERNLVTFCSGGVCLVVCVSFLPSVLFLSPLLSRSLSPPSLAQQPPVNERRQVLSAFFFFLFFSPDRKGEIKSGILVPFPAIFSTLFFFFLSPLAISGAEVSTESLGAVTVCIFAEGEGSGLLLCVLLLWVPIGE